jgi:hypothetical protein
MGTLQIEHWWPVSRGGSDDASNLCLACELCNQAKWAKVGCLRGCRSGGVVGVGELDLHLARFSRGEKGK